MLFVTATLMASTRVIFVDEESTRRVMIFSFYYWINTFFSIGVTCVHMEVLNHAKSPWRMFMWIFSQLAITLIWVFYSHLIFTYIWAFLRSTIYVAYMPFWLVAQAAIHAYIPALKITGMILFMYGGFLAMFWMSRWIRDPYDMETSLNGLTAARRISRLILKPQDKKRVGLYPLGERVESDANGTKSRIVDNSSDGFKLLVRAPTLEYRKGAATDTARTTGSNPMDEGAYPEVTPETLFKSFFGPSALPRTKSPSPGRSKSPTPRRSYPTAPICNPATAKDPATAPKSTVLPSPAPVPVAKFPNAMSAVPPEELFRRFFGGGNTEDMLPRPSRSRTRAYSDIGAKKNI